MLFGYDVHVVCGDFAVPDVLWIDDQEGAVISALPFQNAAYSRDINFACQYFCFNPSS